MSYAFLSLYIQILDMHTRVYKYLEESYKLERIQRPTMQLISTDCNLL